MRPPSHRPFSRRSLLKSSSALALGATLPLSTRLAIQAAAQQATPTRNIAGTELKILQWSHFVPSYDTWFDEFAKAWGDANQVKITVDHINTAADPGHAGRRDQPRARATTSSSTSPPLPNTKSRSST